MPGFNYNSGTDDIFKYSAMSSVFLQHYSLIEGGIAETREQHLHLISGI
jgi:hypothetical protein